MRDRSTGTPRRQEAGFALILAIMALLILTFLGLTLATTTSTELQISANYRWSQQALYNAEAGIELGKRFLRQIEWDLVAPPARDAATLTSDLTNLDTSPGFCVVGRPGPNGELNRNCENYRCDAVSNQGYGLVLDDVTRPFPFQNITQDLGETLDGNFTIWVRRPMQEVGGVLSDYTLSPPDVLVMTVEGTAPYAGSDQFSLSRRAVRYLEVQLLKIAPGDCENRTAQSGSGPGGSGFDQCDAVRAEGILGGASEPNTGAQ